MIKFIWKYLKNYKISLAVVAICSILTAAINLMNPYLTAKFIDEILIGRDAETFYKFILVLLSISILAIAANWLNTILTSKMRLKINNRVIEDVMSHVYRVRGESLFKMDMVYLSKRLDQDVIDLIRFAIDSLVDTGINFALLCMAFFLLCSIGIKWAVIFLIIAILHGVIYRALERILLERSTTVRETDSRYFTCLSDIFLYIYSIKLHSVYSEFLEKFRTAFEKNFAAVMKQVQIIFWFSTSSLNANAIFKVLIFLLGGVDVLSGDMTIGNFVALNGYYMFAMQGVAYFMNIGQGYQNALAAFNRIMEIKSMPLAIHGSKILSEITSITIENLTYNFGEREILKSFSEKFESGQIYCIFGKNGSGKTTLINLICGLLSPMKGTIKYNGVPVREIDMIDARKNRIAVVEQKDFLKNDNLSGGERRKTSIKRAFDKSADVLIMDEPDNNLDLNGINELIQQISNDKKNRITIIISHDERILSNADEIIYLDRNM